MEKGKRYVYLVEDLSGSRYYRISALRPDEFSASEEVADVARVMVKTPQGWKRLAKSVCTPDETA